MRRVVRQIILAFCLGCASGPPSTTVESAPAGSTPQPLVGTWESASLAYEMMGTTLIFAPDGTFATVIGVMLGGAYKTAGNALTVTLSGPGETRVESGTMRFSTGAVEIRSATRNRNLVSLARVFPNSLIGQWVGTQDNGVTSYEEYTSDGRMRLRFPARVGRGLYEITGDTTLKLRMVSPPSAEHPGVYRIRVDTLWTGARSRDIYLRARPLIPADVQQPKVTIR